MSGTGNAGSADSARSTRRSALPVILVIGATAAGKSALAIALAQAIDGEVVSADAMAVYRGLDIATAKPTPAELAAVPHHLVSALDPDDRCDVGRWLAMADAAIADIHARGRVAIVAGGSPLYTKALIEGLSTGAPRDMRVRAALEARYAAEGAEALFAELQRVDPVYAAQRHANDRQRVVRALEVHALTGRPFSSFHVTDGVPRTHLRFLSIGLRWDKAALHQRINRRARSLFAAGLVAEIAGLRDRLCAEAAQAVGCKEVLAHLRGEHDLATAQELVARNTRHLAKHQLTWYRRFRDVRWLAGDASDLVAQATALARGFLAGSGWEERPRELDEQVDPQPRDVTEEPDEPDREDQPGRRETPT